MGSDTVCSSLAVMRKKNRRKVDERFRHLRQVLTWQRTHRRKKRVRVRPQDLLAHQFGERLFPFLDVFGLVFIVKLFQRHTDCRCHELIVDTRMNTLDHGADDLVLSKRGHRTIRVLTDSGLVGLPVAQLARRQGTDVVL